VARTEKPYSVALRDGAAVSKENYLFARLPLATAKIPQSRRSFRVRTRVEKRGRKLLAQRSSTIEQGAIAEPANKSRVLDRKASERTELGDQRGKGEAVVMPGAIIKWRSTSARGGGRDSVERHPLGISP
jgi:hypothetical protein